MKKKEYRVFVVDVDLYPVTQPSSEWFDDEGNPQEEALKFMEYAEEAGRVFSLKGFQHSFNSGINFSDETDYILITNKY